MSHITKYYIGSILKDICIRLTDVSKNVFAENRPETINQQMKEFIVVKQGTRIYNYNPYQKGYINILLYMRKKAKGLANTGDMDAMANKIISKFPIVDERYSLIKPYIALQGDDQTGFSIWAITARLIVNTTDSYV